MPRSQFFSTIVFVSLMAIGGRAYAQSNDAVAVLYNGGVQTVDVFDMQLDPDPVVTSLGSKRIVPADVGPIVVNDIKILPDGSYLLAGAGGRGVAVTTPDGSAFRFVLDDKERLPRVDAASVASYFSPGEPSLVALGDSNASNATIRSTSQSGVVWFATLMTNDSFADVAQVIVMPGNRVALAVNWTGIGISGIQIRDASDSTAPPTTFLSASDQEIDPGATILGDLDRIRDIAGLDDGTLLVTTAYEIFRLNLDDGTIDERFGIADLGGAGGEFASARPLGSGRVAVAAFEPGQWITPHTNHRIYWVDLPTATIVARSPSLPRAPLRVEPLAGTGGTGTDGFDAGLNQIEQGDPTAISLTSFNVPTFVHVGEHLLIRATIHNDGTAPVGLSRLVVRGAVGACTATPGRDYDFATAQSVAIGAGQDYALTGNELIDGQFEIGTWCAYVEGLDQQGQWHTYGDPKAFDVREPPPDGNSSIVVTPLPDAASVMGDVGGSADAGSDAGGDQFSNVNKGCCATLGSRRSLRPGWLLLLLAFVAIRVRRRATS